MVYYVLHEGNLTSRHVRAIAGRVKADGWRSGLKYKNKLDSDVSLFVSG